MTEKEIEDIEDTEEEVAELLEEPLPAPPPKPQPKVKAEHQVSFSRYFISLQKPMHHKPGMAAFTNTSGKKTYRIWDELFSTY
ncbi:MAG: hypothetical protein L3J47_00460 [Sulfurovum sp.]|nr:hypothetical protein [Sulfurovum sp.]